MDAFDFFFFQGKFKTLAQESGLDSVFFIMQFLIALLSVIIIILIIFIDYFKSIYGIGIAVILQGIFLGFALKLIAFNFMKNKKNYFLENLFPLRMPKILFPNTNNSSFLNKNMKYMYLLWMFCWYSVSDSVYMVKHGEGGGYYFVIIFFGFGLPLINYLLFLRLEYYKLFGKE